jgi:hypothetical protein
MTREEHAELSRKETEEVMIDARALTNKTPRTLIYGYTCDRDTFELILLAGHEPCFSLYIDEKLIFMGCHIEPDRCVPDKRIYPAKSDFEFCSILKSHGVYLSFTTYYDEV